MSGSVDSHRPSVLTLYFGHFNFFPETRICSCPILEPIQRASVLLSFNLRPEILPKSSKNYIADVRYFSEPSKIRMVSSAYWLILTSSLPRERPLMLLLLRTVLAKTSAARINKYGESGQPCLTPLRGWKKLLDQPLLSTQLSMLQ